jgi:hypothetical protein
MSTSVSTVTIFVTSAVEASLVRSFLESHGIAARLEDEHTGTIAPFVAAGGGAGAIKVSVAMEDATEARDLLAKRFGSV